VNPRRRRKQRIQFLLDKADEVCVVSTHHERKT
jgi:hypothetical protein